MEFVSPSAKLCTFGVHLFCQIFDDFLSQKIYIWKFWAVVLYITDQDKQFYTHFPCLVSKISEKFPQIFQAPDLLHPRCYTRGDEKL